MKTSSLFETNESTDEVFGYLKIER